MSGNLNRKMGGPSIYPQLPEEVLFRQSNPGGGWDMHCPPEERNRRSVYSHVKRTLPVPILAAFDAADTDGSCPVRYTTTQPTQALVMLNSDFLNEQAAVFAADVRRNAGEAPAAQVRLVLRRVFQREPVEPRRSIAASSSCQRCVSEFNFSEEEALRSFCLMALNLNEFIYLD